jgi:hypothetical protein
MEKRLFLFLVLVFLAAEIVSATWPTDYTGMRSKAIVFSGRLLCLVESISPYIILIMIVIGGLKYLAADDASEILMARTMVFDAVIGGVCVLVLIAVAESFEVPVNCGV